MLVHIQNTPYIQKAFALDRGCYLLLYFQFRMSTAFVVPGSVSGSDALDEQSLVCSAFYCQKAFSPATSVAALHYYLSCVRYHGEGIFRLFGPGCMVLSWRKLN